MFDRMFSLTNWRRLVNQLEKECGVRFTLTTIDDWFQKLSAYYDQPWRVFNTPSRVGDLLQRLNGRAQSIVRDPLSLKMAIWFDAADYVPGRTDNAQKSMALFRDFAHEIGLPEQFSTLTCLILAPTTDTTRTADGILFADLHNLLYGMNWDLFLESQDKIREEHVTCGQSSDSAYQIQTAATLRRLLAQDRIFHNEVYWRDHEVQARSNMARWLKTACP